jgi:hypothetical protein
MVKAVLISVRENALEGRKPRGATCFRWPKQPAAAADFRVEQGPEGEGSLADLTLWPDLWGCCRSTDLW